MPQPFPYGKNVAGMERLRTALSQMPQSDVRLLASIFHGDESPEYRHRPIVLQADDAIMKARNPTPEWSSLTTNAYQQMFGTTSTPPIKSGKIGPRYNLRTKEIESPGNLSHDELVHESYHATQQPVSAAQRLWGYLRSRPVDTTAAREIPAVVAGVTSGIDATERFFGQLPSNPRLGTPEYAPTATWYRDQAKRFGVLDGKSIEELLTTTAGQQWLRHMVQSAKPNGATKR